MFTSTGKRERGCAHRCVSVYARVCVCVCVCVACKRLRASVRVVLAHDDACVACLSRVFASLVCLALSARA